MIQIVVAPDTYACMTEELAKVDGVVLTLDAQNYITHIKSNFIDADVAYTMGSTLTLSNIKKHGIVKFASEETIKAHMEDLIRGLKCGSNTPLQDPNVDTQKT